MRLPNWNLLVAFEAVARHGSFSTAAEELNVPQPAVSRRLALLEQDLGVRLINGSRSAATLTTDGQILFRAVTAGMVVPPSGARVIATAHGDDDLEAARSAVHRPLWTALPARPRGEHPGCDRRRAGWSCCRSGICKQYRYVSAQLSQAH